MKRVVCCCAVVGLACVAGLFLMGSNRPMPSRWTTCTIEPMSTAGSVRVCSVTVSNTTDSDLLCSGGFNKLWFEVRYSTNGAWQQLHIRTPGGGNCLIAPHRVLCSTIEVPQQTQALNVGLDITNLSWRGRLGWWIAGGPCRGLLKPLVGFLVSQDERNRSRMEWSSTKEIN
jgi:hypothetical protein